MKEYRIEFQVNLSPHPLPAHPLPLPPFKCLHMKRHKVEMKKKKKKKCQLGSPLRPITRTTPDSNDLTFDLCRDPYRWTPFQLQFHLGNHFEFDFLIFFLLSFFVLFLFSFRLHFTTHRPSIARPSPVHRRPIAGPSPAHRRWITVPLSVDGYMQSGLQNSK